MLPEERHPASARPSEGRRRTVRRLAAALAFAVAVLYLVLMALVANAEAGRSENTFGAYLFLSALYLVNGVLVAYRDKRNVYVLGMFVQVGVIALFVLFGVGVFGPGVFQYEAVGRLLMPVWAGVITGAEVVLLGVLSYLAVTAPHGPIRTEQGLP